MRIAAIIPGCPEPADRGTYSAIARSSIIVHAAARWIW